MDTPRRTIVTLRKLLDFDRRMRKVQSIREINFVIANHWPLHDNSGYTIVYSDNATPQAVTGVSIIDNESAFFKDATAIGKKLHDSVDDICEIDLSKDSSFGAFDSLSEDGYYALWVPSLDQTVNTLFIRSKQFSESDLDVARGIVDTINDTVSRFRFRRSSRFSTNKIFRRVGTVAALVALLTILFIPVPLTVLGDAEIVSRTPEVLRAPFNAIVSDVLVTPNQLVQSGIPLVRMDTTQLSNKLVVAAQDLIVAQTAYRQAEQKAMKDDESRGEAILLSHKVALKESELEYLKLLISKSTIKATKNGRVLIEDPSMLIGKPFAVGERVLSIASEEDTEIEAWLAPSDLIDLSPGDSGILILDSNPLATFGLRIRYIGYEPSVERDLSSGHRVRATITRSDLKARLGARGVARLTGGKVPVWYWLFRRPLSYLRRVLNM
jgi:multidrug resistance efflux pump